MENLRDALLLGLTYVPLIIIAALPWTLYRVRNRLRARRRRPD